MLASSVIDGKLYVIGGRISGSSLDNVDVNEMYDPIQDRWVISNLEPMPSKRSGIGSCFNK